MAAERNAAPTRQTGCVESRARVTKAELGHNGRCRPAVPWPQGIAKEAITPTPPSAGARDTETPPPFRIRRAYVAASIALHRAMPPATPRPGMRYGRVLCAVVTE